MFIFDRGFVFMTSPKGTRIRVGSLSRTVVNNTVESSVVGSQYVFPIKFVGGKQSLNLTAESGSFDGRLLGEMAFNTPSTSGSYKFTDSTETLIGGTFTPAPPDSYAWSEDLGVVYCSTGQALSKVSSSPAVGQYAVTAGVYTFAAGDNGQAVKIAFLSTGAQGLQYAITNTFQGLVPTFEAILVGSYGDKQTLLRLPQCVSKQLTLSLALEQWATTNFEFEAQSSNALDVGLLSISDIQ